MVRSHKLAFLFALLVVPAAAGTPAASANSVTQRCESPPLSGNVGDCSGWHTADVRLTWEWEPRTEIQTEGCDTRTFTSDTPPPGIPVTCSVEWSTMTVEATTFVKVDETPPVITGAIPARAPDAGVWWTRPVAFTFQAVDQTSGVAACDTVTYGGGDGLGVQLSAGCRDVAGNRATGAQSLNYDATPPSVRDLSVARDGGTAVVRWRPSADVVRSEIVRSADADDAPARRLYSGTASTFSDVTAGEASGYRYTVTVFDEAGNAASATTRTAGRAGTALSPAAGARLARPPLLRWKRKRGATYYNVQLFRGSRKILSAWPRRNRLKLRAAWRYAGRRQRLVRGSYRWYVWPGRGPRSARRYGKLIGSSTFTLRSAARASQQGAPVAPDPAPVTPDPAPVAPDPRPVVPAPEPKPTPQPQTVATPAPPAPAPRATATPRARERPVRRRVRRSPAKERRRDADAAPAPTPVPTPSLRARAPATGVALGSPADDSGRLLAAGLGLLGLALLSGVFLSRARRLV